jgi:hypothetical protein
LSHINEEAAYGRDLSNGLPIDEYFYVKSLASYLLAQSEAVSQEARIVLGGQGVNALLVKLHACSCEVSHGAGVVKGSSESLDLDPIVVCLEGWASKAPCMDMLVGYSLGYVSG